MMMLYQHYGRNGILRLCSIVTRLFDLECSCHFSPVPKFGLWKRSHFSRETVLKRPTNDFLRSISTHTDQNETHLETSDDEDHVPTFTEFASQLRNNQDCRKVLMTYLKCSEATAEKIVGQIFFEGVLSTEDLIERINTFEKLGIKTDDLEQNPSVLFTNFEKSKEMLTIACQKLNCDGHTLFPLLELNEKIFKAYLKSVPEESLILHPFENRIKYLSEVLEVSERAVSERLIKYPYLLTLPASRMKNMMNVLIDAGVDMKHIYDDLWVFRFNVKKAEERIAAALDADITDLKPWIVRCPDKTFQRFVHNQVEKQAFPATMSKEEKLASVLNCSIEEVDIMVKNDDRVLRKTLSKVQQTAEILKAEGFSTREIVQNPRIFLQISSPTLEERLHILREKGLNPTEIPNSLRLLSKKTSKFNDAVKRLAESLPQSFHETESNLER